MVKKSFILVVILSVISIIALSDMANDVLDDYVDQKYELYLKKNGGRNLFKREPGLDDVIKHKHDED